MVSALLADVRGVDHAEPTGATTRTDRRILCEKSERGYMSNETNEAEKIREALILADRSQTHAVEIVAEMVGDGPNYLAAGQIAQAMKRIADRAINAKMMVLATTISSNATPVAGRDGALLVVTILCHWAEIEKLEANRRQQELMGQPGPRRMS